MEREVACLPGLRDVTTDMLVKNPQLNANVDRDKAAAPKLNTTQIENALYDSSGLRWVFSGFTQKSYRAAGGRESTSISMLLSC